MRDQNLSRPKRVLVITNPAAGCRRRARLAAILDALRDRGCDLVLETTSVRGDAELLARSIDYDCIDVVAIAGGDGTINEVLNGLDATAPPVAIIPIGTANVLAAEIGLGSTAKAIADTIAYGRPKPICLGIANERRFAVMASVGLDAEVVRHVSLDLKRYLGKGAYAYETLHQLLTLASPAFELSIEGRDYLAHGVIIANGRYFGGQFIVAPNASLDMPSFDICRCTRGGRRATLCYLASMVQGRLADRDDYEIVRAKHVRINGPEGAPVQADGDIITELPATISIQRDAVKLMYPPLASAQTDRSDQSGNLDAKPTRSCIVD